jgi:hypothetical protein
MIEIIAVIVVFVGVPWLIGTLWGRRKPRQRYEDDE